MSMNSPHESVKDIVSDVWKNNRPLALAVLFIAGVVVFILYKKSQDTLIAQSAATTPAGVPANIKYGDITNITTTTTTSNPVTPIPGPPVPPGKPPVLAGVATIRSRDVRAPYDKAVAGGVPIRVKPGTPQTAGLAPYGSTIQLIGAAVSGGGNFGKTGSTAWYPVAGGYISAFDIASIK